MAKVSIVIPIYNVASWINRCLDSALSQTLQDIEIVCVDDYSQDGSRQILKEYAAKDNRVIAIFNETNLGTSQTRKNGVGATTGDYIMFLDGDDELVPEACEVALHAIEEYKTDMVQFNTQIINCSDTSEDRIASNQAALAPYLDRIEDTNLLLPCWKDKLFSFTLWNKIYRGDLCRHVFTMLVDGYYPKAQDLYAFFLIAYYSKSYIGIEDVLYIHNFGIGVTGNNILSLEQFDTQLTEKSIYDALIQFKNTVGDTSNVLAEVIEIIHQSFLRECTDKWYRNLYDESLSECFDHLINTWGFKGILCTLASLFWYDRSDIADKMLNIDRFCYQPPLSPTESLITIAAYYHSIYNGGAQKVASTLCNVWANMCDVNGNYLYNVILITDEGPNSLDYPLNNRIQREYLPDFNTYIKEDYSVRFDAWKDILSRNNISLIISSAWISPCTIWDMLCVKGLSQQTAFTIHSHSFNCIPFKYNGNAGLGLTRTYMLCDGVVTLSACDRKFAENFSNNVQFILNPITFDIQNTQQSTYDTNVLIWVGRFSYEKQPLDAIYMMSRVVQEIPDAILYMIGEGDDAIFEKMASLINELGIRNNIILPGFTLDVDKYYNHASILISTSECEGCSMVFSEAMGHALPIITYDLPWLTFIEDGRGIITVPQKRYDLLAQEVIDLLHDRAKCKSLGEQGRQQISELASHDIKADWQLFIDNTIHGIKNSHPIDHDVQILFNYLSMYQQIGRDNEIRPLRRKLKEAYTDKSEINAKLQHTYHEKSEINAKLQQTYAEKSEINTKLQQAYMEKSEINTKLQQTYHEKSEINTRLQQTYKEKSERGVRIKELESQVKELQQQSSYAQQELEAIRASFSFRLGHALTKPARWLRSKLRS